MNKIKKRSVLHKKEVFYSLVIALSLLGAYVANFIEDHYRIIANGIVGIAVLCLIYLIFLSPKNKPSKLIELEDLEFPSDIKYLFFGFLITMVMFLAAGQFIELVQYLLFGSMGR
jgi:predicted MFS family arabinose efflux permease